MFDLHTHTTASDGVHTPRSLVQMAKKIGLTGIAITDHDILAGYHDAALEGERLGVEVIPGIELSTVCNGVEVHILGYFIDPNDDQLQKRLKEQRDGRKVRNQKIIEKLNQLGIPIRMEEVAQSTSDSQKRKTVGRPHIAEVLIRKGIVGSIHEAFEQFLGVDGKAYVPPSRITSTQAISFIQKSGGIAVIAHPGLYGHDEIIPELVQADLNGIETHHPDHSEQDCQRYLEMAKTYNLLTTAGSDFHGERNGFMHHAPLGTCTLSDAELRQLKRLIDG